LDALCKRYGVSLDSREKHGALIDAKLLAEVYLQLNGGRERSLELETSAAAVSDEPGRFAASHGPRPTPLPPASTPEERAEHAAFVETLGEEALWKRYLTG
ncbi:MAG: DNA polymerase III subunit epsilon, partial [Caulobacterales bacterium]|nr:DNA polymerase III subunit epsilon [Caulobacterales bacterium]